MADDDVTAGGATSVGTGMVGVANVPVFNGTVGVVATTVRTGTVGTVVPVVAFDVVVVGVTVVVVVGFDVVDVVVDDVVVVANGFCSSGTVGIGAPQVAVVGHWSFAETGAVKLRVAAAVIANAAKIRLIMGGFSCMKDRQDAGAVVGVERFRLTTLL